MARVYCEVCRVDIGYGVSTKRCIRHKDDPPVRRVPPETAVQPAVMALPSAGEPKSVHAIKRSRQLKAQAAPTIPPPPYQKVPEEVPQEVPQEPTSAITERTVIEDIEAVADAAAEYGLEGLWEAIGAVFALHLQKDPVATIESLLPAVGEGAHFCIRDVIFEVHCRAGKVWLDVLAGQGILEKSGEDTYQLIGKEVPG